MLKEYTSKHFNIPYVFLPKEYKFVCKNGVMFTYDEYKKGLATKEEFTKRSQGTELYDYQYALENGRTKRLNEVEEKVTEEVKEEPSNITVKEEVKSDSLKERLQNKSKSLLGICLILTLTVIISMYISTLHTATYLNDYVDIFSAWLMSASVTAYNATAFEVSVIFHTSKRNFMATVFMFLWVLVTLFSMITTVSVFYDRFNFNEMQITQDNKGIDSAKNKLTLLQKKEQDLREAIEFKKKDIEYRQSKEFSTNAVRLELKDLENKLQENLSEQEKLLFEVPETVANTDSTKESLYAFMGRLLHIDKGILEFIMSTLSAIFINLICPLSLTAITELLKRQSIDNNK